MKRKKKDTWDMIMNNKINKESFFIEEGRKIPNKINEKNLIVFFLLRRENLENEKKKRRNIEKQVFFCTQKKEKNDLFVCF